MKGPICQNLLQQHLDGQTAGDPSALDQHLLECPECALWQDALRRLDDGLRLLTPPAPPADLAGRIVAQVCAENRRHRHWFLRRRWLAVGAVAVAASLLLALGIRLWGPSPDSRGGEPNTIANNSPPTPPIDPPTPDRRPGEGTPSQPVVPLRDTMEQASEAVVSLTSRTAEAAMGQTASTVWRGLPFPAGSPFDTSAIDLQEPLEPPARPFREARDGVTAGLEPVADSARRAVGMFLRDLSPMGMGPAADTPQTSN
jgi:hypothetical protein